MTVAVEAGDMDGVDAHLLEHTYKFRHTLELACHRVHRHRHVVMAGESDVARQLRKSIAVRVTQRLAQGVFGAAAREQVEDAQPLTRAGRRIEPRLEGGLAVRDLPHTKPERGGLTVMSAA